MAGISMNNVGHCHPAVVTAIADQAARLINVSNLYYTEPMVALAEWIRDHSLGGRVYFCNSGAEANEAALKLARKHGGPERTEVVSLVDGFHGRTYGALSLTGQPGKQEAFPAPRARRAPRRPRRPRGAGEETVGPRTCAIFLEIVQGECGVHPVPDAMVRLARELADRHGALLIVDEIQTGLSRTGPLFAYQDVGVTPDVMCLAKSLGGGVPIGAIVATPEFDAVLRPGRPRLDLRRRAAGLRRGARLLRGARAARAAAVRAGEGRPAARGARGPRGRRHGRGGPRTGAHVRHRPPAREGGAVAGMLERGFLINNTSDRTLRMLPPLVIDQEDLDALVLAFREVLPTLTARPPAELVSPA